MKRLLRRYKSPVIRWIPLAFTITMMSGLIYIAVQQNIRLSANDPQAQMATDISAALSVNESTELLIPKQSIDIGLSLAPFVILYDESGKPTESSVVAEGQTPTPPAGVFAYTRAHNEDRITWEPQSGVRIATVMQHYQSNNGSGFVLAGRNMREIEKNEQLILQLVAAGWLVALAGSLGLIIAVETIEKR